MIFILIGAATEFSSNRSKHICSGALTSYATTSFDAVIFKYISAISNQSFAKQKDDVSRCELYLRITQSLAYFLEYHKLC